jgi:hypothetical protein
MSALSRQYRIPMVASCSSDTSALPSSLRVDDSNSHDTHAASHARYQPAAPVGLALVHLVVVVVIPRPHLTPTPTPTPQASTQATTTFAHAANHVSFVTQNPPYRLGLVASLVHIITLGCRHLAIVKDVSRVW